jgi:hypothetical protein
MNVFILFFPDLTNNMSTNNKSSLRIFKSKTNKEEEEVVIDKLCGGV